MSDSLDISEWSSEDYGSKGEKENSTNTSTTNTTPKEDKKDIELVDVSTYFKNKDYIYILSRDDEVVCFSENKSEIIKALDFQKDKILIDYCSDYKIHVRNTGSLSDVYTKTIYTSPRNFFMCYENVLSVLKVQRVLHSRTVYFNSSFN